MSHRLRGSVLECATSCWFGLQLADFGFAAFNRDVCKTTVGTNAYMAPEVFSKATASTVGYTPGPTDVWSAAVCFFIMLTGFPPWGEPTRSDPFFQYVCIGTLQWLFLSRAGPP